MIPAISQAMLFERPQILLVKVRLAIAGSGNGRAERQERDDDAGSQKQTQSSYRVLHLNLPCTCGHKAKAKDHREQVFLRELYRNHELCVSVFDLEAGPPRGALNLGRLYL